MMAPHAEGRNGFRGNSEARQFRSDSKAANGLETQTGTFPPLATAENDQPFRADRDGVTAAFDRFAQHIRASRRPLPTQNGDGTVSTRRKQTGFKADLKRLAWKDVKTLVDLAKSKIHATEPVDDKTMLMERIIVLVAGLPTRSRTRVLLTDQLINELWYSREHPVLSYIGEFSMYRAADGSNNSHLYPSMGAAGTTYARSVRPTVMPRGALPDPGLIYDTVMRRSSSGYRKHPNNVSSVLWYWATIIIHDLFWTDPNDMNKSKTSSYLDLSPLYGSNQEMQDTIRTFRDGMLKPDAYADKRLNGMPAGVSVLLIMFNRFHNHVAKHLALINEGGRFTPPPRPRPWSSSSQPVKDDEKRDEASRKGEAAWEKYDDDLFQTARLVTSGLYINITLVDYVRNIVNLNRCDTTWTLDPRREMGRDAGTTKGTEAGTGNVVSAEFNLCYRWHSCISEKDDRWIQEFYAELFGKPASEVGIQDMAVGFAKFERSVPDDPGEREFGGYKRDPATGKFDDDDLVDCITSAIEDCAGAFGARNVPVSMRPVEILGILQARKWHVAGLNEFRRHLGLKPYETFEELNSDPEVASCLRHLYEHPDFVELYPGLVAEEAKQPMVPGVGIAPTYTISRVVLSDAVCLVRGDRHYTIDYSPQALTNWGFNEAQYDLNLNHGCVFYKLFVRAFSGHFRHDSVYAHYPMVIPSENHRILTSLKRAGLFTWERPSYSRARAGVVSPGDAADQASEDPEKTQVVWNEGIDSLLGMGGARVAATAGSSLSLGDKGGVPTRASNGLEALAMGFYLQATERLLEEKSYVLGRGRMVDIVRDVGNVVTVQFASRLFNLPLKTASSPKGIYTEEEMYSVLTSVYITIFRDMDPVKTFPLRQAAKTLGEQMGKLVEAGAGAGAGRIWGLKGWFASEEKPDPIHAHGANMIKDWSKSGISASDLTWGRIMPAACHMVPTLSMLFAQVVDFYLSPPGKVHLPQIQALASRCPSLENDRLFLGYILEGLRLAGRASVPGNRSSTSSTGIGGSQMVTPTRPFEDHPDYGLGSSPDMPVDVQRTALMEMLRAVLAKRNLRRAPGPQGELKKVAQGDGSWGYLTEDWSSISPLPTSMRVCWDED